MIESKIQLLRDFHYGEELVCNMDPWSESKAFSTARFMLKVKHLVQLLIKDTQVKVISTHFSPNGAEHWCLTAPTNSWLFIWDILRYSTLDQFPENAQAINHKDMLQITHKIYYWLYSLYWNFEVFKLAVFSIQWKYIVLCLNVSFKSQQSRRLGAISRTHVVSSVTKKLALSQLSVFSEMIALHDTICVD